MEKNGNGSSAASDSSGVCEKLFSAITANPAFQTIPRISSPARARSPLANLNYAAGKKVIDIQGRPQQPNKPADQVIQVSIKFEKPPLMLQPATPNGKVSTSKSHDQPQKPATRVGPEQKRVIAIEHITHGKEGKKEKDKSKFESSPVKGAAGEQQHINAATKPKHAQQVQAKNEGNDMNDKFSDYISRARMKMRTMSSKKIQEPDHDHDVHFTDYIQRAKNKFKSSSSIVGGTGKFASFKRDE